MILEIDIGNTRIKWRLRKSGCTIIKIGACVHRGQFDYDDLFSELGSEPECVYVVTVIVKQKQQFKAWFQRQSWSCPLVFAEVARHCAGVTNGYRELGQMGPDRWVAMVSAFSRYQQACVVIDCGSACTVDVVNNAGEHLGGFIVPGLNLMREALYRDTDRVKLPEISYAPIPALGLSTQEAVASGIQTMLLAMIVDATKPLMEEGNQARRDNDQRPLLVVTGGMGDKLSVWLTEYLNEKGYGKKVVGIELQPDLVFDGLPLVCEAGGDTANTGIQNN